MFSNYLKIAFRNLLKHRGYALINIAGLAIGMASCLLILLYVLDELSYDRFHQHADRIYRATIESAQGQIEVTPSIVGPLFQREFPEVERMARFYETTKYGALVVQHQERLFQEERFWYADSTVFEIFSFPFFCCTNPPIPKYSKRAASICSNATISITGEKFLCKSSRAFICTGAATSPTFIFFPPLRCSFCSSPASII